jgi:hypothetical protein
MGLRIACDLDGTLADMDAALQREARRLFGPDVDLHAAAARPMESAEDVEGRLAAGEPGAETAEPAAAPAGRPLSRSELRKLWAHVGQVDNFWRSLGEIEPGAVARLAALAARHQWEVLFLTQRPPSAGETAQVQSQRWLHAHGFEFPSVFVMNGSRGRVASALSLDAVLDDRPENCLDVVADSKAIPFLIWRLRRDAVPPGVSFTRIQTMYSMSDALDRLEQLTAERAAPKTILDRVRTAMGLKGRADVPH